jgi:hypothetical protein
MKIEVTKNYLDTMLDLLKTLRNAGITYSERDLINKAINNTKKYLDNKQNKSIITKSDIEDKLIENGKKIANGETIPFEQPKLCENDVFKTLKEKTDKIKNKRGLL